MKSSTTIKSVLTMSLVMLILSAGFIIYSYDREGHVKLLNEDDYEYDSIIGMGDSTINIIYNPKSGEIWEPVERYGNQNHIHLRGDIK